MTTEVEGASPEELHALGRQHRELAVKHAHEGIKILTYLNGGALAAIPVATRAFDAIEVPFPALLFGSGIFAAGLLLVGLVCLFAFLADDTLAVTYHTRALGELDDDDKRHLRRGDWYRYAAIVCAIASWLAFVIACAVIFLSAQDRLTIEWMSLDDLRRIKGPPVID